MPLPEFYCRRSSNTLTYIACCALCQSHMTVSALCKVATAHDELKLVRINPAFCSMNSLIQQRFVELMMPLTIARNRGSRAAMVVQVDTWPTSTRRNNYQVTTSHGGYNLGTWQNLWSAPGIHRQVWALAFSTKALTHLVHKQCAERFTCSGQELMMPLLLAARRPQAIQAQRTKLKVLRVSSEFASARQDYNSLQGLQSQIAATETRLGMLEQQAKAAGVRWFNLPGILERVCDGDRIGFIRAVFSSTDDIGKTVQIKDGRARFDGIEWTVNWHGDCSTDGSKQIIRVEDSLGGKISLQDGMLFENPGVWSSRHARKAIKCPKCKDLKDQFQPAELCSRKLVCTQILGGFRCSTKIQSAIDWVQRIPPDDKAIIFSFFKGGLDLLEGALEEKGIRCQRFDGDVTKEEARQADLDRFRQEKRFRVLLATVNCGGTGLNITQANHILFLDRCDFSQ